MEDSEPQKPVVYNAISKNLLSAVHVNVAQESIMITEDKTYRCLNKWSKNVERQDSWIAPVSLLASLTLTFVTSSFDKDAFGISRYTWHAVFLIAIVFAAIWTIRALWLRWQSRDRKTVEDLIQELKNGAIVECRSVNAFHTSESHTNPGGH